MHTALIMVLESGGAAGTPRQAGFRCMKGEGELVGRASSAGGTA